MDLSQWILQHASRTPARTALHYEGEHISYAAFASRIEEIASALAAQGVGPGARVDELRRAEALPGLGGPEFAPQLVDGFREAGELGRRLGI